MSYGEDRVRGGLQPRQGRRTGQLHVYGRRGDGEHADGDVATAAQIADFLENCDAARYAPGAIGTLSSSQAAANVRDWIAQIERN